MIEHVGHTMATPELELPDALKLFARLGLDAAEVVTMTAEEQGSRHGPAAGEARIFSHEWPDNDVDNAVALSRDLGVPIVTLTQYVKAINSPDEGYRPGMLQSIERHIRFASRIGARYVRIYGGSDGLGMETWPLAVEALRRLAGVAHECGVLLILENHPGTLTVTGEATAKMVREVGEDSVRVLYDPANVLCHSDEAAERTLEVQKGLIAYVHVKDFRWEGSNRVACPVGQGIVPWPEILDRLVAAGYSGPLSYEYERKWNPRELPPADQGLRESVEYIRSLLATG